MRRTFVGAMTVALAAVAAPAGAQPTGVGPITVGTSSCYVYVDRRPLPTIQTTWPFIVFPMTGGPNDGVHCPLPSGDR